MTFKSRGHCDNIKVFNQGKLNLIREKSGNLIAKMCGYPVIDSEAFIGIVNESLPIRRHSCQPRLNASPFFFDGWMDGWMDDAILCPFNSISIISG